MTHKSDIATEGFQTSSVYFSFSPLSPAGAFNLFPRGHDLTKGSIFGSNGINRVD